MSSALLFPLGSEVSAAARAGVASPGERRATRRLSVETIPVRSALTRQEGASARWFDWSANPYRGRELACGDCSARGTQAMPRPEIVAWLGHDAPRESEERIDVKEGFAAALRRDLRRRVRPGEHVAFGTATDPYQPIERREGVTRESLRVLAQASGLRISITTKSSLVLRDADLLREVGRRNSVRVNVTITTPDRRLARFLEPRAPPPGVRIATLRALRREGIRAGVFLMPVLPGVTDAEADLVALFRAASDAGADSVAHQTVFLEGAARAHFLPLLRRQYPRVAARYEVWTRAGRNLPDDVRAEVARRVRALAREFGLDGGMEGSPRPPVPPPSGPLRQREFEFAQRIANGEA